MGYHDLSTTGWIAGWPDNEAMDRWMDATEVTVRFSLQNLMLLALVASCSFVAIDLLFFLGTTELMGDQSVLLLMRMSMLSCF
jgi:hypothetical protein